MLTRRETILLAKVEQEIKTRMEIIANGGCGDYAEYRQNVGFIKGLELIIQLVNETDSEISKGQI